MAQVAIFKQIFDKVRNNLNYHWFYSELKRHNVSHYIYYLATENIHLVLENDKEGANKQVISSQVDSLIKISRIWADFFPANTSNQPI